MENFNQIEYDILNKIKNVSDRNSYEAIKTEIFGKKGIITGLFNEIGSLDQNKRKEYASKLNALKTKVTITFTVKVIIFQATILIFQSSHNRKKPTLNNPKTRISKLYSSKKEFPLLFNNFRFLTLLLMTFNFIR